jgi:formylglycine-generating enzyme required for sulfatase activity/serine/threonine protein kinase
VGIDTFWNVLIFENMQLQPNDIFAGRYRLIRQLGQGGFSIVWLVADQMAEETEMALKIYAPDKGMDESGLKMFRREYALTAQLNHPGLLKASYFDIYNGSPYLVMPYCERGSLNGLLMEQGQLSEQEIAKVLLQTSDALAYLHSEGIIHQDIKPDNVLINNRGNYLLTDFGISSRLRNTLRKSTNTGKALTVAYAPPERFGGSAQALPAGDIFSLGVMIFELSSGDVPWMGAGGAVLHRESQPLELPDNYSEGLQRWMQACLSYDPSQRPTAEQLKQAAATYLESGTWPELSYSPKAVAGTEIGRQTQIMPKKEPVKPIENEPQPIVPAKPKDRKPLLAILLLLLVVATVSVWLLWPGQPQPSPDPNAQEAKDTAAITSSITQETPPKGVAIITPDQLQTADKKVSEEERKSQNQTALTQDEQQKLAKERAALEEERIRLQQERERRQREEAEDRAWQLAQSSNTKSSYENYLRDYPSGRYAAQARQKIEELNKISLPAPIQKLINDMVSVQGGTFSMGCTSEQGGDCYDDEKPTRSITLRTYSIGKYEVTQAQWRAVMNNNPSKFSGCDNCPVENVSWEEVQDFIRKLNQMTGQKFRLPTEAEWEFAARGGNKSKGYKYSGSNNLGSVAWHDGNSSKTQSVGQKQANELGLYDMSGNVAEWCSDWYGTYSSSSSQTDPRGPTTGNYRVVRGGNWLSSERKCRVSDRASWIPTHSKETLGFRLAMSCPQCILLGY